MNIIKKKIIGILDIIFILYINIKSKLVYKWIKLHFYNNFIRTRKAAFPVISNGVLFFNDVIYADENWDGIRNIQTNREKMKKKQYYENISSLEDIECHKYEKIENGVSVETPVLTDNWLCFFRKDITRNFQFSFDLILNTEFTEVQIAFNYYDLGNRYRFMLKNNKSIVFECVYKGEFYHNIWKEDYSLELGRKYHFDCRIKENEFLIYIDGELIMAIKERKKLFDGDKMAFILWEAQGNSPIKCIIEKAVFSMIK